MTLRQLICGACALALAACSTDETLSTISEGNVSEVTFSVQLPQAIATRAYSDGLTATYLTYGVYTVETDDDGNTTYTLVDSKERSNEFVDHKATVSLQLVRGLDYRIVFWGDAGPKCPYTLDLEAQTVTMDYAEDVVLEANNEARDVFYATADITDLETDLTEDVCLFRPLAQVNFGTSDIDDPIISKNAPASETVYTMEFPAGYLPTVFCLTDSTASQPTSHAVKFQATGVPSQTDGVFPVEGYDYLQMNYVLCGEQDEEDTEEVNTKTIITEAVTLTAEHDGLGEPVEVTVYNMPLQRNYRTNVYGALATDPATFEINIEPRYIDDFFILQRDDIFYYAYCDVDQMLDALAKGFNVALLCDMTLDEDQAIYFPVDGQSLNLNGYKLTIGGGTNVQNSSSAKEKVSTRATLKLGYAAVTGVGSYSVVNGELEAKYSVYVLNDYTATLSGVSFNCTGSVYGAIYSSAGTIKVENGSVTGSTTAIIYNEEGDTYVANTTVDAGSHKAICTNTGNVYVSDGSVITASGANAIDKEGSNSDAAYFEVTDSKVSTTGSSATAIYANGAEVKVSDSEVSAEYEAIHGYAKDITVENSTLTAINTSSSAYAIYYGSSSSAPLVTLKNSTVTVEGKNAATGVQNEQGSIVAEGSTISVSNTGNNATNGFYCGTQDNSLYLTMTDCEMSVTASGNGVAYGLQAPYGAVTAKGSTIDVEHTSTKDVKGIRTTSGAVTVDKCTINAKSGGATYCIDAPSNTGKESTITNNTLTATTTSSGASYGVNIQSTLTSFEGNTITVSSKSSGSTCYGVSCTNTSSGGILDADNCKITVSSSGQAYGLYANGSGGIAAQNTTVSVSAKGTGSYDSYCFWTNGPISASNCAFTLDCNSVSNQASALYAGSSGKTIELKNSTIDASCTGGGSFCFLYGTSATTLTATNCTLNMTSKASSTYGIYGTSSSAEVDCSNTTMKITANSSSNSALIYTPSTSKTITATGSTLELNNSGSAAGVGFYATSGCTIDASNTTMKVTSACASGSCYLFYTPSCVGLTATGSTLELSNSGAAAVWGVMKGSTGNTDLSNTTIKVSGAGSSAYGVQDTGSGVLILAGTTITTTNTGTGSGTSTYGVYKPSGGSFSGLTDLKIITTGATAATYGFYVPLNVAMEFSNCEITTTGTGTGETTSVYNPANQLLSLTSSSVTTTGAGSTTYGLYKPTGSLTLVSSSIYTKGASTAYGVYNSGGTTVTADTESTVKATSTGGTAYAWGYTAAQ